MSTTLTQMSNLNFTSEQEPFFGTELTLPHLRDSSVLNMHATAQSCFDPDHHVSHLFHTRMDSEFSIKRIITGPFQRQRQSSSC